MFPLCFILISWLMQNNNIKQQCALADRAKQVRDCLKMKPVFSELIDYWLSRMIKMMMCSVNPLRPLVVAAATASSSSSSQYTQYISMRTWLPPWENNSVFTESPAAPMGGKQRNGRRSAIQWLEQNGNRSFCPCRALTNIFKHRMS